MPRTLLFNTDLASEASVEAVRDHLTNAVGKDNWIVDIADPQRRLIVACDTGFDPSVVVDAMRSAGYTALLASEHTSFC